MQDEESVEDICKQIIKQWTDWRDRSSDKRDGDGICATLIYPNYLPFKIRLTIQNMAARRSKLPQTFV